MAGGAHSPQKSGGRKVWFWILGAIIVALAVALVVVLVRSDDDDDKPATTTTTTTTAPATTTTGTDHDHDHAPATTTTVALPVLNDDPQTYAQYLFTSWQNNDRTAAANAASADAVTQMFAQAYPAKGPYTFSNCNPAAGSLYCTWNGQNGATIQMTVRTLTGGLPIQVESVTFGP